MKSKNKLNLKIAIHGLVCCIAGALSQTDATLLWVFSLVCVFVSANIVEEDVSNFEEIK